MKGSRRSRWAAAAGALALLAGALPASAAIILQSDSTVRVSTSVPAAATWNTSASFDDSGWQNATVLYDVGPFIAQYAGAKGIWSSGGQFSTTETQLWARKVFNVSGPLSAASLAVGCDDDCTVWVNGTQVVNDTDGSASNSFADVLQYLTTGTNLVAWRVTDNFPVWGYNHSTWLQIDGTFVTAPPPSSVPEPATLALLGLGLAGLALGRRRRNAA
jgi:hypothetical protein